MRICFIVEHFFPHIGGVEVAFEEYAKRLSQKGHQVKIITSNSGGITGKKEKDGYKIYYLSCKSFFGHPILQKDELDKHVEWADVVHTTTYTAALPTAGLCSKYKKPCVIMVHEVLGKKWFLVEKNPIIATGLLFFELHVLTRKYSIWQTVSQSTQNDLMKHRIPKEKIKLIYHGMDQAIWNSNVAEKNLNEFLGFEKTEKIFLYNGRPGKTKGIFLLLEAINIIKDKIPKDFKFGFILSKKPTNERKKFEDITRKYKLEGLVKIKDSLPYQELPGYRKNSFAFIAPSLTEGFGFAVAETSALKVPIIASSAGSLPEVASGKVLFFENGNSTDLAEKILLATENKFQQIPEKKFDWDESSEKIMEIYQNLI